MSKEEKIQECQSKQLLDELSKMPPMVIATAYLHAINYTLYGVDVTTKWETATQNAIALEKAYKKGYYDALQRQAESEALDKIKRDIFNACSDNYHMPVYRLNCDEIFEIIDKYKAESEEHDADSD